MTISAHAPAPGPSSAAAAPPPAPESSAQERGTYQVRTLPTTVLLKDGAAKGVLFGGKNLQELSAFLSS